jgi:hypothetical protein
MGCGGISGTCDKNRKSECTGITSFIKRVFSFRNFLELVLYGKKIQRVEAGGVSYSKGNEHMGFGGIFEAR